MTDKNEHHFAFIEKLASSGVSLNLATECGLHYLSPKELTAEIGFSKGSGALKIPYNTLYNSPTGCSYPPSIGHPPFARYRFLGEFDKLKYYQMPGTSIHLYQPRGLDTAKPILITEGELKTLAAIENGFNCIGLPGVDCFTAITKRGSSLHPLLQRIPPSTHVYICFDYDGADPSMPAVANVNLACRKLAALLSLRGVKVHRVHLGTADAGSKVGLDDYLLSHSAADLLTLLDESRVITFTIHDGWTYLLATYVDMGGSIVDVETCESLKYSDFRNCNSHVLKERNEEGKFTKAVDKFMDSKYKVQVTGITVEPTTTHWITADDKLNLWRGWLTKPVAGSVAPWHEFEELLFRAEPSMHKEFSLFVACLIQRPAVKQTRLPILQSRAQGVGKSLWAEAIAGVLNSTPHGQPAIGVPLSPALVTCGTDLGGSFNGYFKGVKLLVLNELGERGVKHTALIKDIVSGSSIQINEKFKKAYTIPNMMQPVITTNEDYTHHITATSRRELVLTIPDNGPIVDELKAFLANVEFFHWLWSKGAQSALLHYYMNYPLGDYTGNEPAPHSAGKATMVDAQANGADIYIIEELGDVEHMSPTREYMRFLAATNSHLSPQAFRAALRAKGWGPCVFDKTHGQISWPINGKYPPGVKSREVMWSVSTASRDITKTAMLELFLNRYYKGSKV